MPRRHEPEFILPTSESEIAGLCGPQISEDGRQLWQSGAVADRERDEEEIYADVVVGGRAYEASFDQMIGPECDCRDFERTYEPCRHVAALLWAWVKEPDTFSEDWYDEMDDDEGEDKDDLALPGEETLQFMTSPEAALFTVGDDLIRDRAGKSTAKYGRELWRNGAVSERRFDGETLKAVVHDGAVPYLVRLNSSLIGNSCTCGRMTASTANLCVHGTAVLYAWQAEMETFLPQEPAGIKLLFDKNPALARILKEVGGARFERLMSHAPRQAAGPTPLALSSPAASTAASSSDSEDLIKGLLSGYRIEDLRLMAKRRDWKLSGTLKDGLVQQLHDYLREWGASGDVTEGLSPDETWLLQYTATALGVDVTPTRGFFETAWKHAKRDSRRLDPAINGLVGAGLFFPCGQGVQAHYHILPYLTSPPLMNLALKPLDARALGRLTFSSNPPVLDTLARLMQATESAGLMVAPLPPRYPQEARYAWLRGWKYDVSEVEKLVQSKQAFYPRPDVGIPVWLSLNRLTPESLSVAQSWTGASVEVIVWLFESLAATGLLPLSVDPQSPVRVNAEAWAAFQVEEPAQQIKRLWAAWLSSASDVYFDLAWAAQRHGNLAVMRSINVPANDWSPGKLAGEMVETRRFLSRMLASVAAQSSVDEWVAWNDLCTAIFDLRPNTLHFNYTRQVWWLAMDAARGNRKRYDPHNRGDWDKSVRHVLAAMMEGPLQWLGLVELGYERDTLSALRMTPLGRWLLTGRGEPPAVMLASGTVEPPAWLDAETWRLPLGAGSKELAAICRALGLPDGWPFTYRMTNESIERALLAGFSPSTIAAEFRGADIPMPEAAQARIEQAAGRIGRVRLYEGLALVEFSDDTALKELLAGTSLKKHLVCQLSPRLVVVNPEATDALAKELVEKGYTPRVT
jgi:hypothetical protein